MNKIEELIEEAYRNLKSKKSFGVRVRRPSEEDLACYTAGLMDNREKEKILDDIILHSGDEESLRQSILLAADISGRSVEEVPESLVAKVKQFVPQPEEESVLDAVVEFAGNITRVIRTTGSILTSLPEREALPAGAFRDSGEYAADKAVEISKAAGRHIIDIKIAKIKKDLANLTVEIKDKRNGAPSSEERVSLMYQDRELRSSLTEKGKVEFENIKIRDYRINLIRKGESRCIATLSMRALEE